MKERVKKRVADKLKYGHSIKQNRIAKKRRRRSYGGIGWYQILLQWQRIFGLKVQKHNHFLGRINMTAEQFLFLGGPIYHSPAHSFFLSFSIFGPDTNIHIKKKIEGKVLTETKTFN